MFRLSGLFLSILGARMAHTEVKVGQAYQHYSGKWYEIVAVGRLTESKTLEECVVYKSLYDDPKFPRGQVWIRPLSMFIEEIEICGQKIPRFKPVK